MYVCRKLEKEKEVRKEYYTNHAATRHRKTRHGDGSREKPLNVAESVDILQLEMFFIIVIVWRGVQRECRGEW